MKKLNIYIMLAMLVFALSDTLSAQQALGSRAELKSPEINADKCVTFRLKAPKAENVMVIGDCFPEGYAPMTLSADSIWEYTTAPLMKDNATIEALKTLFAKNPKLYYIAIGKDDFLLDQNNEYRKILDGIGANYVYVESDGGHIWRNWRDYLTDFLTRLFK